MPIRIVVADDHPLIRQGIRTLLKADSDLCFVGEASNGMEAVTLVEKQRPDIAIIDISMKQLNGIDATAQISKRSPSTAVIVLSMFCEERYVNRAVRAGAAAYVLKDSTDEDLVRAIAAIREGKTFFSPAIAKVLLDAYTRNLNGEIIVADDQYDRLTEREREIFQLLAEGKTNKSIATMMGLSIHTVQTHRIRLMGKLDLHNTAELVLAAVRRGIVV